MIVELMALGALLQSVGLGLGASRWLFQRSARKVSGRVVIRRKSSRSGVTTHAPTVEFTLDDRVHRFESRMFGTGCPELGVEVDLLVHPEDPGIVVIRGWSGGATAAYVCFALGTVMVLLGLGAEPT